MSDFPIQCMICSQTLKGDNAYLMHMQTMHGTQSTSQAMAMEKAKEMNLPKDIPVVPVDKDAPPSAEFMEMAKMMDQPKSPIPAQTASLVQPKAQVSPKQEEHPIVLKYRYDGNCPHCNTPVRTIMAIANGKSVAIAYCLTHEQLEEREVLPLGKLIVASIPSVWGSNDKATKQLFDDVDKRLKERRKEMNKHARKRKPQLLKKAAISEAVRSSKLPETNQASL